MGVGRNVEIFGLSSEQKVADGPTDDVRLVAESEQVRRYLEKYRQVLVTTYREFVLVGYDADGLPALLESQCFAAQGRRPIVSEMRGGGEGGKRLSWDRVFTLIEIEALDVDASRALDG